MFPKYFQTPFASSGDKAGINDQIQPDGTVSYQEGYGADYETNPAANGGKFMFVERSQMNGLLNDITDNLKQWQEQGYYTYNPAIKYGIGGRCNYNDGTGLKLMFPVLTTIQAYPVSTACCKAAGSFWLAAASNFPKT